VLAGVVQIGRSREKVAMEFKHKTSKGVHRSKQASEYP
jgi:hypothetical protein